MIIVKVSYWAKYGVSTSSIFVEYILKSFIDLEFDRQKNETVERMIVKHENLVMNAHILERRSNVKWLKIEKSI